MNLKPRINAYYRVFDDNPEGDVIALWRSPSDRPGRVLSYQIVGQHSEAMEELIDILRPARENEKWRIRQELQRIGYIVHDADKIRRPINVLVRFSESPRFPDESRLYPFREFEQIASSVAWGNPPDGCYDKTSTVVTFDDGTQYECRLDLKQGDDTSFRSHVESMIYWMEQEPSRQGERYQFLREIDFDAPAGGTDERT